MSSINKKSGPKTQISSVAFMWISFAFGVLAVLSMFLPLYSAEGQIYNVVSGVFPYGNSFKGAWPAFIGFMLILIAALLTGFLALPMVNPSYSSEKLLLIIANVCYLIGSILVMLISVWYCVLRGQPELVTHAGYNLYPGAYICLAFSIVGILCNTRAIILDK